MSVKEIFFVIMLALLFILMAYKTITLDPKKKPKVWPVYLRIIIIVASIGLLALAWIFYPDTTLINKILFTVYPILFIYRALKGWLFSTKEKAPVANSEFPH